jgi:glycosyltransferase involved in cell wall biosynthesis
MLVSVIVPVYNVKAYLSRCVESLLNQTYSEIEIILVDDGSTDGSGDLCDEYGQHPSNKIKVIHKTNGGLSDARNTGIKIARGSAICVVDSDDFVAKTFIQTMVSDMVSYDANIACVEYMLFSEDTELSETEDTDGHIEVYDNIAAVKKLLSDNPYGNYAWNKLYKRELFAEIKYPLGRKMEDLGTTYRLMEQSQRVVYDSRKLYYYFQRADSIVHKPDMKFYVDKLELSIERYSYLKSRCGEFKENVQRILITALECYPYVESDPKARMAAEKVVQEALHCQQVTYSLKIIIKLLVFKLNKKLYCEIFGKK